MGKLQRSGCCRNHYRIYLIINLRMEISFYARTNPEVQLQITNTLFIYDLKFYEHFLALSNLLGVQEYNIGQNNLNNAENFVLI